MTPDLAILGAGPAGSTLAALLARRGFKVLVFDDAKRDRAEELGARFVTHRATVEKSDDSREIRLTEVDAVLPGLK
jgi:flavin-dependent dehydrogenase